MIQGSAEFFFFLNMYQMAHQRAGSFWDILNTLTWTQHIAAAIGVAKGIQFLHTEIMPGVNRDNHVREREYTPILPNKFSVTCQQFSQSVNKFAVHALTLTPQRTCMKK